MERDPRIIPLYNEEEQRIMQIGARLLLMELLAAVRNDWNGQGTKLWAHTKIKEMETQNDDYTSRPTAEG